jgi:hypothetical protein
MSTHTPASRPAASRRRTAAAAAAVLLAALAVTPPALAQSAGRLVGAVLNGLTGQPVPGATVTVVETGARTTTDPDGLYRLDVPPGAYTLAVTKGTFAEQRVADVAVAAGQSHDLSVVLMPAAGSGAESNAAFGEEITVAAEADTTTDAAMLAERRRAGQISDLIGSQEMARTTGGDAAGVLKRVTGISLQDDRYVYVRGLGDRYSNTLLNGSKIPSTEFEKKVVPLDLFPTDLLDKVRVAKSYSVDKPGDFAAGFVELETLQFPNHRSGSIGLSVSQDSIATGEPYLTFGGGLDFFGDGGQPLPSSIPGPDLVRFSPFTGEGFTPAELEAFGEQLAGVWQPSAGEDAPLDRGYKLAYGDTIGRLGLVLSASYDNDFDSRLEETNIFSAALGGGVTPQSTYDAEFGEESVRQSALANFAYRLSANHNLRLRSLYTNLANAEGRFLEGFYGDFGSDIRDHRVSYREQEVVNLQLSGDHYLGGVGAGGSLVEWQAASSTAETAENRRQAIYRELTEGIFRLTPDAQSGFMYFNDLADDLVDTGVSWTTFLSSARLNGAIKAGVAYTAHDREFDGRRLRFFHRNVRNLDLSLPPDQLFVPENIGPNGFEVEEITRPTDRYDGTHDVAGAYAQADLGWGRWRLIGGLRYEDSQIELVTLDRNDPSLSEVQTELDETAILPALSVVYQLGADMNLRGAFSRTLNRPELRELAPFKFTHVVGGYSVTGNPDLESADIASYDLRWEWFPSASEVVAVSVFYKDFDQPIESVVIGAAELLETYENADSARNYGVELEMRREFGSFWPALAPFSIVLNGTWVDSEIEIDPNATILTNPTRALVGQPEVVGNVALEWDRRDWGSNVRLLFNHVGEKVAAGGALGLPDVLEESRSTLDLVWSQSLGGLADGLVLKLSGSNLTEEESLWTQGGGIFRRYEPGREIGASVSYSLF